jgi:hypothetical protein
MVLSKGADADVSMWKQDEMGLDRVASVLCYSLQDGSRWSRICGIVNADALEITSQWLPSHFDPSLRPPSTFPVASLQSGVFHKILLRSTHTEPYAHLAQLQLTNMPSYKSDLFSQLDQLTSPQPRRPNAVAPNAFKLSVLEG